MLIFEQNQSLFALIKTSYLQGTGTGMLLRLTEHVPTAEPSILHFLKAEAIPYFGRLGTWEAVNGLETLPDITSVVFPEHP